MILAIVLGLLGAILLICGTIFQPYVLSVDPYAFGKKNKLESLTKRLKELEVFISPTNNSKLYNVLQDCIRWFDIEISVARFWSYKLLSFSGVFLCLTLISFTNSNVLKSDIMGSWWQEKTFLSTMSTEDYKYNANIYKEVVLRIGEKKLKKLSDEEKVKEVSQVLKSKDVSSKQYKGKAEAFVNAYNQTQNISVITINIAIFTILSFFLPEILYFFRKIIIGKKYKREAIKMENIFGLLGSIEDYKTINILKDMAQASKLFKKQLNHAIAIFYTDKNKSFDYLKNAVEERSFARLVDTIRVYSTVDKKVALTILERNLKEQEEQLLLTAEEDMDVIDIVAFLSIIPILYEMANLLLKPLMDVVFEAFNFV